MIAQRTNIFYNFNQIPRIKPIILACFLLSISTYLVRVEFELSSNRVRIELELPAFRSSIVYMSLSTFSYPLSVCISAADKTRSQNGQDDKLGAANLRVATGETSSENGRLEERERERSERDS